ncbi:hypothetical protein LZ31DRAFT_378681 [Colletotrichum somersetense]|nr:hypothetical protein LZ31DRAFT_378681 [Colletotrichum somersetense]
MVDPNMPSKKPAATQRVAFARADGSPVIRPCRRKSSRSRLTKVYDIEALAMTASLSTEPALFTGTPSRRVELRSSDLTAPMAPCSRRLLGYSSSFSSHIVFLAIGFMWRFVETLPEQIGMLRDC